MVSEHDTPTAGDRTKAETAEPSPAAAFQYAFDQFAAARTYFKFYLRTRAELFRLAVRNFLFVSVLTVAAVILAAALIVTAVVQVARGIAEGLTILFGGNAWVADLVTGLAMLVVVVAAMYGTITQIASASKKKTFSAYAAQEYDARAAAPERKVP
jgi:uncharacterized membrane protein